MGTTEFVSIYIFVAICGLFLFAFILRWVLNTERIIKNQEIQIEALVRILKHQGSSKDEVEGVRNVGK